MDWLDRGGGQELDGPFQEFNSRFKRLIRDTLMRHRTLWFGQHTISTPRKIVLSARGRCVLGWGSIYFQEKKLLARCRWGIWMPRIYGFLIEIRRTPYDNKTLKIYELARFLNFSLGLWINAWRHGNAIHKKKTRATIGAWKWNLPQTI